MISPQDRKFNNDLRNRLPFSYILSFFLLFNFYLGVTLSFWFDFLNINLPLYELLILKIFFLLSIPIISIPFILAFLPYGKIDFSLKGIFYSILHKIFFIITFPFVILGLIIGDYLGKKNSFIGLFTTWSIGFHTWGWILLILWIYFTLHIWELFFGKDSSQSLKMMRFIRLNFENEYKKLLNSKPLVPNRVIFIGISIPIITIMLSLFLGLIGGLFIKLVLTLISFDIIVLLISLLLSSPSLEKNQFFTEYFSNINKRISFKSDISDKKLGYGLSILVISGIFSIPIISSYYLNLIFIVLSYGLLIIVFTTFIFVLKS